MLRVYVFWKDLWIKRNHFRTQHSLVFVTHTVCVYCAVRAEYLNQSKVKRGLERVTNKHKLMRSTGYLCVCGCVRACVRVCVPFQLWNDKREGSRMPLVTVVPLDSTFANGLRKTLQYYPYTFNPFIIFSRCTIIIIIRRRRTRIYINFLLLHSGLSENMFRNSFQNCLLVLCLFNPYPANVENMVSS